MHDLGWKTQIWCRIPTVYQVGVNGGKYWEIQAKTEGRPERNSVRVKKKNSAKIHFMIPLAPSPPLVSVNFASGCWCQLAHLLCWMEGRKKHTQVCLPCWFTVRTQILSKPACSAEVVHVLKLHTCICFIWMKNHFKDLYLGCFFWLLLNYFFLILWNP